MYHIEIKKITVTESEKPLKILCQACIMMQCSMIEENGTCTSWFKGLNFKVNLNRTVSSSTWYTFAFDIFVFFTIILSVIRRVSFALKKLEIGKLTGNKPCTLKSIKLEFTNINFLHKYSSYTYNDHWPCMRPNISYIY